jgi:predicted neuraminidase
VIFSKAGSYTRQPLVEGANGELLLPLFYSASAGITDGAQNNYSAVEISTDAGKTRKEFEVQDSKGMVYMDLSGELAVVPIQRIYIALKLSFRASRRICGCSYAKFRFATSRAENLE